MTVAARVPVEAIGERARQARPGRAVLTVIAAVLFGLGGVTAKAAGGLWLALAWCVVAVKLGWEEGRKGGGPPGRGPGRERR